MPISARPVLSQCLQPGNQLSACGREHICSRYVANKESGAQSPSTLLSSSKSRRLPSIHTRNALVRRYAQESSTPEMVCSRVTECIWRRVRGPPAVNHPSAINPARGLSCRGHQRSHAKHAQAQAQAQAQARRHTKTGRLRNRLDARASAPRFPSHHR